MRLDPDLMFPLDTALAPLCGRGAVLLVNKARISKGREEIAAMAYVLPLVHKIVAMRSSGLKRLGSVSFGQS